MEIRMAETEADLARCYPVMAELRPHHTAETFAQAVRLQAETLGYRLAYVEDAGTFEALAGFRIAHSLAWGRHLYVDDLVTRAASRSKGYGAALLEWLVAQARREGCEQFHLDSGVQRERAHAFYFRHGLTVSSFHFGRKL